MNKEAQAQAHSLKAKYARKQARQHLQSSINTLQKTMYNMECYLEKLENAKNDAERADVMNWAINHLVCNIMPNVRIDLLARSQAELAAIFQNEISA
jgi:hypothetical protein